MNVWRLFRLGRRMGAAKPAGTPTPARPLLAVRIGANVHILLRDAESLFATDLQTARGFARIALKSVTGCSVM